MKYMLLFITDIKILDYIILKYYTIYSMFFLIIISIFLFHWIHPL